MKQPSNTSKELPQMLLEESDHSFLGELGYIRVVPRN